MNNTLEDLCVEIVKRYGILETADTQFYAEIYREWMEDMMGYNPQFQENFKDLQSKESFLQRSAVAVCKNQIKERSQFNFPIKLTNSYLRNELSRTKCEIYDRLESLQNKPTEE